MAVYAPRWVRRLGGGVPEVVIVPEDASQTFKRGAPLVWDTSAEAVKAATDTTVALFGIADADASGTTGADIPVIRPTDQDQFSATISAAGANSAAAHDKDNIGFQYSWILSTETGQTTKVTIDESDTTNKWVVIDDIYTDANEPAGTAGGRVLFRFIGAAIEAPKVA